MLACIAPPVFSQGDDFPVDPSSQPASQSGPATQPASRRAPTPADARMQVAAKAYNMNDYPRAERELRAALELEPNRAEIHMRLGIVLYKLQHWGDAAASLKKSLELDKSILGSLQILGHCNYELGKIDEALECYNKVLERSPAGYEALRGKGLCLEKLGKYDEAEDSLRKAVAVNTNTKSASAHLWLARVLTKKKQPGAAIPYLEQAQRIDPFDWEVQFELSRVYAALSENTKAKAAKERSDQLRDRREVINKLKKRLQVDPSDVTVIMQLGAQYDAIGDVVHAKGAWDKARQIARDDPKVIISQAWSMYTNGDLRTSEELLKSGLKGRPNDPSLWESLWFVLKERGDKKGSDEAAMRFKQITNRDPANPIAALPPVESQPASSPAR